MTHLTLRQVEAASASPRPAPPGSSLRVAPHGVTHSGLSPCFRICWVGSKTQNLTGPFSDSLCYLLFLSQHLGYNWFSNRL